MQNAEWGDDDGGWHWHLASAFPETGLYAASPESPIDQDSLKPMLAKIFANRVAADYIA
jgi:hypothetical protein